MSVDIESLKKTIVFRKLKEDEELRAKIVRLGDSEDWVFFQRFITEVVGEIMQSMRYVSSLEDMQRYQNQIIGLERVILAPEMCRVITKMLVEVEVEKKAREKERERRKFNPGSAVTRAMDYLKK